MTWLTKLHDVIIVSILSDWLTLEEFALCNTSYCNATERILFETLTGNNKEFVIDEHVSWLANETNTKLNWLIYKKIHLNSAEFNCVESSSMNLLQTKFDEIIEITNYLQTGCIDSLSFTNMDTNKHTGQSIIDFINRCDKLKSLCIKNCNFLEGSEFVSSLNLEFFEELSISNCSLLAVNFRSVVWISNTTRQLTNFKLLGRPKYHFLDFTLENLKIFLKHNCKSLSYLRIEIAGSAIVDHLSELCSCLKFLRINLIYGGVNLPAISLTEILSFVDKHKDMYDFGIIPWSESFDKPCFHLVYHTGVGVVRHIYMSYIPCSKDELVCLFGSRGNFTSIYLKQINCVSVDIVELFVSQSSKTLKLVCLDGCNMIAAHDIDKWLRIYTIIPKDDDVFWYVPIGIE